MFLGRGRGIFVRVALVCAGWGRRRPSAAWAAAARSRWYSDLLAKAAPARHRFCHSGVRRALVGTRRLP